MGLPNVGKSTLFNAVSNSGKAQASNYRFCTIEPIIGLVDVPDPRLDKLAELVHPNRIVPTQIEIVDIAGLVRGASKGEGLGNQFLGNIRSTDAIIHVLRCFDDDNVVHVDGNIDPIRDKEIIDTELQLKDLDSVDKRIQRTEKLAKTGDRDLLRGLEWPSPSEIRFKAPLVRDTVLASRLERLFAGLEQGEALLQSESSMLSVVARLLTDHVAPGDALREPGREHAAIRRVKEWLEANPEQNVSVHALAAEAGLSPYYLVRAFHKHVGMPPHRYQTVVRVLRARKFLRTGMPIAEAAYQAGFYDQSHLTRSFKCTLGTTPGRYSRAHTPLT